MMADKVYGTSKGRPVDESEIGHLVAEAEDGYDTDAPGVVAGVDRWDLGRPMWFLSVLTRN